MARGAGKAIKGTQKGTSWVRRSELDPSSQPQTRNADCAECVVCCKSAMVQCTSCPAFVCSIAHQLVHEKHQPPHVSVAVPLPDEFLQQQEMLPAWKVILSTIEAEIGKLESDAKSLVGEAAATPPSRADTFLVETSAKFAILLHQLEQLELRIDGIAGSDNAREARKQVGQHLRKIHSDLSGAQAQLHTKSG